MSLPKMSYNVPFESAIIVPSKAAGSRDLAAFGFGLCIGTSQGHGPSAHAPSRIWAPPAGCDAGILYRTAADTVRNRSRMGAAFPGRRGCKARVRHHPALGARRGLCHAIKQVNYEE